MIRRSRLRRGAAPPPWALLSYLLRYPEDELAEAPAAIAELPPGDGRDALERFCAACAGPGARERYVQTFDLQRGVSLHLTWYEHGDTRRRGAALLHVKRLYRAAGFEPVDGELPDHLALMLAFAALAPEGYGPALLQQHRAALELLRAALRDRGSLYADVLDVVCAALPPLHAADREDVARLGREGPGVEEVGLEPYVPVEVMPEARP